MEDKINAFIKAAGVNIDSLLLGWVAHALASVNTGSLICHVGAGGPVSTAGDLSAGVWPPTPLLSQLKRRTQK